MLLSIYDRLMLLQALQAGAPAQGSYLTMRIVSDLQRDLSFTEEEIAEREITQMPEGNTQWKTGPPKAYNFMPVAFGLLVKGLSIGLPQWDEQGAMTVGLIRLCDKFGVEMPEPVEPDPDAEAEAAIVSEAEAVA